MFNRPSALDLMGYFSQLLSRLFGYGSSGDTLGDQRGMLVGEVALDLYVTTHKRIRVYRLTPAPRGFASRTVAVTIVTPRGFSSTIYLSRKNALKLSALLAPPAEVGLK